MLTTKAVPSSIYATGYRYVSEGYAGKTKLLLDAERCCNNIVAKIKKEGSLFTKSINDDPNVTKLCASLKKQFGFGEMDINFNTSTVPNAFTVPAVSFCDAINGMPIFERPDKDSGKFYDKTHSYYAYVEVFHGIIVKLNLTGEELLAIILHEIGHNFDTSIFRALSKILMIGVGLTGWGLIPSMMGEVIKYVFVISGKISSWFSKTFPFLDKLVNFINEVAQTGLALFIPHIPSINIDPIALLQSKSAEIFADSFAAYYGYGPALASGLAKFKDVNDKNVVNSALEKFPLTGVIIDLNQTMFRILCMFFDGHPDDMTRLQNNIKKLEKDVNDPHIPKRLKKSIKNDIKLMKNLHEQMLKIESYEDRNQCFSWMFKNLNAALGENLDLANLIARSIPYTQV